MVLGEKFRLSHAPGKGLALGVRVLGARNLHSGLGQVLALVVAVSRLVQLLNVLL